MIDAADRACPFIGDYPKMIELCAVIIPTMFAHTVANPGMASDNARIVERFVALASSAGKVSMLKALEDVNELQRSEHKIGEDVIGWVGLMRNTVVDDNARQVVER